jgi:hypothetical protein
MVASFSLPIYLTAEGGVMKGLTVFRDPDLCAALVEEWKNSGNRKPSAEMLNKCRELSGANAAQLTYFFRSVVAAGYGVLPNALATLNHSVNTVMQSACSYVWLLISVLFVSVVFVSVCFLACLFSGMLPAVNVPLGSQRRRGAAVNQWQINLYF